METYNEEYYREVYTSYIEQTDYHFKLSRFYLYNIFISNGYSLEGKKVLDFGSGPGHLTLDVNAHCYDISEYIRKFLREKKRVVYNSPEEIPDGYYDVIFNSHSLEHCINPNIELQIFRKKLKNDGILALVLPIEEVPGKPSLNQDIHKHMYSWNFQSITNLLVQNNFTVQLQKVIYGPMGLKHFKNLDIVKYLGKLKNNFPSMLIIAK